MTDTRELIGAFVETEQFQGRIIKETDKAICIKGKVTNWIPKTVFEQAEYMGEVQLNDGMGDGYRLHIPQWMTVKKDYNGGLGAW